MSDQLSEAEISGFTPQQAQPDFGAMSTDDLLFMIGRQEVEKQAMSRQAAYLQNQLRELNKVRLALESQAKGGLQTQLESVRQDARAARETLEKKHAAEIEDAENRIASLSRRIVQLEEQSHAVALERDQARAELAELKHARATKNRPKK